MRVVLCAIGSRGDVTPFLTLARELRVTGANPVLTAPPQFASEAASMGLEFRPIAADGTRMFAAATSSTGSPLKMSRLLSRAMRVATEEVLEQLPATADGSDIIVATGVAFAAPHVAEALGIEYLNVSYCPRAYPCACQPTFADSAAGRSRLANTLAWRGLETSCRLLLGGAIDSWRRDHGLPRVSGLYSRLVGLSGERLLVADEELAPLPREITGVTRVSAIRPRQAASLPEAVEDFLVSGDAPVYFGFGSAVAGDATHLLESVLASAGRLGVRTMVPEAWAAGRVLPDGCLALGDVSHSLLFPRVAAVVHHGGAGTTTTAARSGVRQMAIPVMMDQNYWGLRIHELSLGPRPLAYRRVTSRALSSALHEMLTSSSMAEAAQSLSERLTGRDGASELAEVLCREASMRAPADPGGGHSV